MKVIKTLIMALCLMSISSCDFWKSAKEKVAEAAGDGVEKLVKKELAKHSSCSKEDADSEAVKLGGEVETKLLAVLLKVDEGKKSLVGDVLKVACKAGLKTILPQVLSLSVTKYPCSASYFGNQSASVADKVCEGIKL